jgi:hypothetical protein
MVVAVLFVITVLAATSLSMALGYDEAVYASQVTPDVPAAPFSAHRARGMSWLLWPVAALTAAAPAIRVYLALLSGLFLYAAFRPWLGLYATAGGALRFVPAVAAGLFATLWPTVLHGVLVLPNLWLAFALAAGVGHTCRLVRSPPAGNGWWWIVAAFAAAALLRPTDATIAAAPVVLALLLGRRARRARRARLLRALAAVVTGLAVGWVTWAVEAFARFGDPVTRLRAGADTVGGGLTWNLPGHLAALGGPCPPAGACPPVQWPVAAWWLALPVLVGIGLVAAARARLLGSTATATACAVAVAVPYLVLVDVAAATRLLLPSYALLAPAVATGLCWLVGRRTGRTRAVAATAVTVLVAAHVAGQQEALGRARADLVRQAETTTAQASFLRSSQGVTPPCLIVGEGVMQQGYLLRCRPVRATEANLAHREDEMSAALARGEHVVVRIHRDAALPGFMAGWQQVRLPGDGSYVAYRPS